MSDSLTPLTTKVSDKIGKINTHIRLLWPKYDPDLNTKVDGTPLIKKYIKHAFTDAGLTKDHDLILKQKDLDRIINVEDTERPATAFDKLNKAAPKVTNDISMNQQQIKNVVKKMYGYTDPTSPKKGRPSTTKVGDQRPRTKANIPSQNDYADFYQRMKVMGKDKSWTDERLQQSLANKEKGEKEYKLWLEQAERRAKGGSLYNHKVTNETTERLYRDAEDKKMLKERIAREKELYEIEEAEALANYRSDKHVYNRTFRTVDEFMNDQINFEQRKFENLKGAVHREELKRISETPYHPQTNLVSQKIVEGRKMGESNQMIFYTDQNNGIAKSKKRTEAILKQQADELIFQPTIHPDASALDRTRDHLLQDTHQWMTTRQQREDNMKTKPKISGLQIGAQSDKFVHDRFDQDFNKACMDLQIIQAPEQADEYDENVRVGCGKMSKLFLQLGFVSPIALENEQMMLADIWKSIGGDEEGQETVPLSNCKNILRAIQNFHHQDIMEDSDAQENKGLRFSGFQIQIISSKFRELFKNRQDKLLTSKKESHMNRAYEKEQYGEDFQYKPKVSKKNNDIYEQRLREMGSQNATIEERLIDTKRQNALLKQQLKSEHDFQVTKSLKSRPEIAQRSATKNAHIEQKYSNKWDYLHGDAAEKSKALKRNVAQDEYEFQKDQEQFTFQPNTDRLRSAQKKISPQRGTTASSNNDFQINVNIGGQKRTIAASLASDPYQTALAFIRENQIDEKYLQTLQDLIAQQQDQINMENQNK